MSSTDQPDDDYGYDDDYEFDGPPEADYYASLGITAPSTTGAGVGGAAKKPPPALRSGIASGASSALNTGVAADENSPSPPNSQHSPLAADGDPFHNNTNDNGGFQQQQQQQQSSSPPATQVEEMAVAHNALVAGLIQSGVMGRVRAQLRASMVGILRNDPAMMGGGMLLPSWQQQQQQQSQSRHSMKKGKASPFSADSESSTTPTASPSNVVLGYANLSEAQRIGLVLCADFLASLDLDLTVGMLEEECGGALAQARTDLAGRLSAASVLAADAEESSAAHGGGNSNAAGNISPASSLLQSTNIVGVGGASAAASVSATPPLSPAAQRRRTREDAAAVIRRQLCLPEPSSPSSPSGPPSHSPSSPLGTQVFGGDSPFTTTAAAAAAAHGSGAPLSILEQLVSTAAGGGVWARGGNSGPTAALPAAGHYPTNFDNNNISIANTSGGSRRVSGAGAYRHPTAGTPALTVGTSSPGSQFSTALPSTEMSRIGGMLGEGEGTNLSFGLNHGTGRSMDDPQVEGGGAAAARGGGGGGGGPLTDDGSGRAYGADSHRAGGGGGSFQQHQRGADGSIEEEEGGGGIAQGGINDTFGDSDDSGLGLVDASERRTSTSRGGGDGPAAMAASHVRSTNAAILASMGDHDHANPIVTIIGGTVGSGSISSGGSGGVAGAASVGGGGNNNETSVVNPHSLPHVGVGGIGGIGGGGGNASSHHHPFALTDTSQHNIVGGMMGGTSLTTIAALHSGGTIGGTGGLGISGSIFPSSDGGGGGGGVGNTLTSRSHSIPHLASTARNIDGGGYDDDDSFAAVGGGQQHGVGAADVAGFAGGDGVSHISTAAAAATGGITSENFFEESIMSNKGNLHHHSSGEGGGGGGGGGSGGRGDPMAFSSSGMDHHPNSDGDSHSPHHLMAQVVVAPPSSVPHPFVRDADARPPRTGRDAEAIFTSVVKAASGASPHHPTGSFSSVEYSDHDSVVADEEAGYDHSEEVGPEEGTTADTAFGFGVASSASLVAAAGRAAAYENATAPGSTVSLPQPDSAPASSTAAVFEKPPFPPRGGGATAVSEDEDEEEDKAADDYGDDDDFEKEDGVDDDDDDDDGGGEVEEEDDPYASDRFANDDDDDDTF